MNEGVSGECLWVWQQCFATDHALKYQCYTFLQPLVQDAKDAVVEAATAGALDRRLAALERRVSARLRTMLLYSDFIVVSDISGMVRNALNS